MTTTYKILMDVDNERIKQDEKWGRRTQPYCEWITILTEEVGESAEEALNVSFGGSSTDNLRLELIQVAAVAVAMIEQIDNGEAWRKL